ncbi:hypothetical protein KY289_001188 [Solanum tuberosum]|nr:hypothetical protein KY289_001188 [Solanum tuberosum]
MGKLNYCLVKKKKKFHHVAFSIVLLMMEDFPFSILLGNSPAVSTYMSGMASSQDVLVECFSARKQINQVDSGLQPPEIDRGHKKISANAQSSATEKFSSEEVVKTTNQVTEPLSSAGSYKQQEAKISSMTINLGRV